MRCKSLALVLLLACKSKGDRAEPTVASQKEIDGKFALNERGDGDRANGTENAPMAAPTPATTAKGDEWGGEETRKKALDQAHAAGLLGAKDVDAKQTAFASLTTPGAGNATKGTGAGRPEGVTRAWFPETFLFQPLVVTDEHGAAEVSVRVPDRLTTWRVLALAHSRTGAQGGAVATFLGTLPTYVDPVVPKFLVAGDEVRLPIQLVNTTDHAVQSAFSVDVTNAQIAAARGTRQVPALGNLVEYATLRAERPGEVTLQAALGDTDAVVKTFPVLPQGRPVTIVKSGTLAAPRTLEIAGPTGANPTTDRARLSIVPGALALLRSELAASGGRSGVADDAYALLLAGRAPALLASLGDKADPDVLHDLTMLAAQRALRDARTLDVTSATLLAEAALAHGQNPVLARLGERAVQHLLSNQRPDGTFGGETGWTLARLLVTTAEATRAVGGSASTPEAKQRAQQVKTRAASAFERNAAQVSDGYTAAAILASGALAAGANDATIKLLGDKVKSSIKTSDDGAAYLAVEAGTQRADGAEPTVVEATALAILALDGDAASKALRADLGTTLLGAYSPDRGWGDGRTNLSCMQAVLALFRDPLPDSITVTLTMDGKQVTSQTLGRDKLRDVVVLAAAAPGLAGQHEWKVVAEPAVPGLGYSLALDAWVPWAQQPAHDGLEVSVPSTVRGTVGSPIDLPISAVAPSGAPVTLTQSLPAGVQVDTPALEALVTAGKLTRFESAEGKVTLFLPALEPGQTIALLLRVIPTLAGTLHTTASRIEAAGHSADIAPSTWEIR